MNKMVYRLISVIVAFGLMLGCYYNAGASSASVSLVSANTYYVSVTGNDANAGTISIPFKTIQKCVNMAKEGDTCLVSAGIYNERVTINKPITLKCSTKLLCTIIGADITGGNVTLDGFYSLNSLSYEGGIKINTAGNTIRNNKIEGATMTGITIQGNNNLVENNEILGSLQRTTESTPTSYDADGMRFFGDGNIIRGNYIHDIKYGPDNPNPHIDCFQTWNDVVRGHATNTVIENNICILPVSQKPGEQSQGFMMSSDSGLTENITIRNNLILAYHGINSEDVKNLNVTNNTFVWEVTRPLDSLALWASTNANMIFQNNIIYNYWSNIGVSGIRITGGGNLVYRSDGQVPRTDGGYPLTQRNLDLWGTNPMFKNTTNITSNDYFRLQPGSPACTGGVNGTYIGAYPCANNIPPSMTPSVTASITATKSPTKTPTITATNTATNTPTNIPTYTPFPPTPVSASPTPTLLPPTPTATASPIPVLPTTTQTLIPTATSTATLPATPTPSSATPTTPPTGITSVDVRVVKGENDVEESLWGKVYTNNTNLELVYAQKVGIRFMGVNIPQGATIVNAYIQFKVGKASTNGATLSIQGDASANAKAFSSTARNVSSRSKTTRIVNWSPSSWATAGSMGPAQLTPNLAPIIQEIINKPDWASGNSIVIIITGNGRRINGRRIAKAYEGDAADAPILHIEYAAKKAASNVSAPLAMAAVASTELPTELPTTATPIAALTATFQPPLPTIPATFTSTESPIPLPLPSLTPTPLAPVLPAFTPTAESINTMSAANEHPVITSNGILSIAENTAAVTTITAKDTDLPAQTLTYSISGGPDSTLFSINPSTGELAFISSPDFEVPIDAGTDNIYNVTVQASDGELTVTQDIAVTVTALNDNNPVVTSNGVLSIAENTAAVTTITAKDTDLHAQTLTYSISGGPDSTLFSINPSTGELTFTTAPDFEVPIDAGTDNIYNVTVQASDGELTVTQDIAVTVTALNDNSPVVTSNGVLSIAENTMAVATVIAADVDLPAQALTYSISGSADSTLFSVNPSTGELTFITAPDFEVPADAGADNIYNVTVQASDGELTAAQDIVVAITALNDNNPVVTSNGILSITENAVAVAIITATDADLPAQALTYSISGGADSTLFNINPSTGELTFVTAPDYEVPADAGIDNIYNVTVQASDGELTATQDIAVTVTALNDNNPAITSNGILSIAENAMAVTTVTATDADLPTQTLTYSISGGPDSALFGINSSTGELAFVNAPDYELSADAGTDNIYNVTIQASDGELTATQDIAVTVTALNDNNPAITSNGILSIAENAMAVATVTATDADLPTQTLTYSISGGADSTLFNINSSTGELTFITAPDYEVSADAGTDNIYNVTVQASDGELTVTQDIAVTVTALNDNNPVVTSNGVLSIAENTAAVTTITAKDTDLPAQTLTYSISGGPDSTLFSINPSTGELTFITAPDFETPMDAGIDNIYNVTVQTSDGTLIVTQNIAVTVKSTDQPQ